MNSSSRQTRKEPSTEEKEPKPLGSFSPIGYRQSKQSAYLWPVKPLHVQRLKSFWKAKAVVDGNQLHAALIKSLHRCESAAAGPHLPPDKDVPCARTTDVRI
jgi:hypothetical protein